MPRKNIYIRDEDQELFEKAEKLGGDNFSATIAEALKRFVEVEESKIDGMSEVEIEVGSYYSGTGSDDVKTIKFIGKKIADACVYSGATSDRKDRGTDYDLYLTKKGKLLLWQKYWTCWQGEDREAGYQVFDSMTQLMGTDGIPGSLLTEAGQRLGLDTAEYLDV